MFFKHHYIRVVSSSAFAVYSETVGLEEKKLTYNTLVGIRRHDLRALRDALGPHPEIRHLTPLFSMMGITVGPRYFAARLSRFHSIAVFASRSR